MNPAWADELRRLVGQNEDWLMERILGYAKAHDYAQYTSTLREAWRMSIEGLSKSLLAALDTCDDVPELHPHDDFEKEPCAAFGILEAQRHRGRGVEFEMFMGFFKYYRATYLDLVKAQIMAEDCREWCLAYLTRLFDRMEIAFAAEWCRGAGEGHLEELQATNRALINEKNKYLTIFESLSPPVILLDDKGEVANLNYAASRLLQGAVNPGSVYYGRSLPSVSLAWLADELETFGQTQDRDMIFEKALETGGNEEIFEVKFARMLDVSGKFKGVTIILNDITARKRAEAGREKVIAELKDALARIKTLRGLIPICANCKNVRDDSGYWRQVEEYVTQHSDLAFSHGLCPECARQLYPEVAEQLGID